MQPEYLDRLFHPKMEFYREVYKDSPRWEGFDPIQGKDVIVYCEQGFGDIIQFARYIPYLKSRDCRIHMHLPVGLHRLFIENLQFIDSVFDKESPDLPPHDCHILSMSLPFVLGIVDVDVPYIKVPESMPLESKKFKVGIAWEGNPKHSNAGQRNCPLGVFRKLMKIEDIELYMIQKQIHDYNLVKDCDDLEILGTEIDDFQDTARLINSMNLIVSVDTSVLHLAGAMGKRTVGLLGKQKDPRWESGVNWYPSIKFIEQPVPGDWAGLATQLTTFVSMERTKWVTSKP